MPLGQGYTVEEQVTDEAEFGGIQIVVFDPKSNKFPDEDPEILAKRIRELEERKKRREEEDRREAERKKTGAGGMFMPNPRGSFMPSDNSPRHTLPKATKEEVLEMGLAAGGSIQQEIVEDQYGVETWDENCTGKIYVRIVNSVMFKKITGREAPPSPICAAYYTACGLPWFHYYDENVTSLLPSAILGKIKTIGQLDKIRGIFNKKDNQSIQEGHQAVAEARQRPGENNSRY